MLSRVIPATMFFASIVAPVRGEGPLISQIYGGGGNSGATFTHDFVEMFNPGTNDVSIAGFSLQYASAAASTWQVVPLSGSIPPGGYFLVQLATGGANGVPLPRADTVGSINLSASAGKVALVGQSSALTGACPAAPLIDLVGYGTSAACFEGAPATGHSSITSLQRTGGGCTDSQNNSTDFTLAAPNPRNSASPRHACAQPLRAYSIHEIQGAPPESPFAQQVVVTTTNIVTAVRSNGFFIQTPDRFDDLDPATSEGIFVFSGVAPGTNAQIGNAVVVAGVVTEFRPANDPASLPRTQINASDVQFVSAANALPAPVALSPSHTRTNGGHDQLERFEGMRVRADLVRVAAPSEGFVAETSATSVSSGVFFAVLDGVSRPLREPGIDIRETLPPGAPCCVPRFDGNPELIRVDSDGQSSLLPLDVNSGTMLSNLVGALFYEAGRFTILPEVPPTVLSNGLNSATVVPPVPADQLAIASINLERFYDTSNDPATSDGVLTPAAYSNRLHKAALLIRSVMNSPGIIGLAEIESLAVLQDIGSEVRAQAIAAGQSDPGYAAWLLEGNDPGGIDVGFLVRTSRVHVFEVRQHAKDAVLVTADVSGQFSSQTIPLHDRPPLVMRVGVRDSFSDVLQLTLVMTHLRSLLQIGDPAEGGRVRAKRRAQAESVAQLVQELQVAGTNVVVMGDFNAYEFNDGYVDVIGTISGLPMPLDRVVLPTGDVVEPNLVNLIDTLPASERYSYIFAGTAQALDHILVSQSLCPRVALFQYVRSNADFAEIYRNDSSRPERISDHDAAIVHVYVGGLPRITSLTRAAGQLTLNGVGDPMRFHAVERSFDARAWQKIGSAVPDQTRRFTISDVEPVSGAVFYRLRIE